MLKITLESEKSKSQITLSEREKEIASLKQLMEASKEKENTLSAKVDTIEQKSRDEYQRLIEMYESSGRYKELRDIYENKIKSIESELLQAKESTIQQTLISQEREK